MGGAVPPLCTLSLLKKPYPWVLRRIWGSTKDYFLCLLSTRILKEGMSKIKLNEPLVMTIGTPKDSH